MADNAKKKKAKWIIPFVACVLILALGGGIWYFVSRGEKPSKDSELVEASKKSVETVENSEPTEPGEEKNEAIKLRADNFVFRQIAFHCGDAETVTQVLAEFYDLEEDLTDLVLIAKCEETGEEIVMTDDGEGADTRAGDHVFYGEASFEFDREVTRTYVLQSQNAKYQVSADPAAVISYTDETFDRCIKLQDEIFQRLNEMAEGVKQNLETEEDAKALVEVEQKMEEYLQSLREAGKIKTYAYSFPYFFIDLPITGCAYQFGWIEGLKDGAGAGSGDGGANGDQQENLSENEEKGIILLSPYANSSNSELDSLTAEPFEEAIERITEAQLGYALKCKLADEEVDLSIFKNLYPYRVIVYNGHGGWINGEPTLGFCYSHESVSQADQAANLYYRTDDGVFSIRSAFFEYYYEDGSLNNCLIYLGCCHGAQSDRLQRTLIRKGAKAVLGFDNTVYNGYDEPMAKALFGYLASPDPDDPDVTMNVADALTAAKKDVGESDPVNTHWYDYVYSLIPPLDVEYNYNPAVMKLEEADPEHSFRLSDDVDKGTVWGTVLTADGELPIKNARVKIEREGWSTLLYTHDQGTFGYSLEEGNYHVTVTAVGYGEMDLYVQITKNHTSTLNLLMAAEWPDDECGIVKGSFHSKINREKLTEVKLSFRKGWNNTTQGEIVSEKETDENAEFVVELPVGYYTMVAEKEGYVTEAYNVIVEEKSYNNDYSLCEVLGEDEYCLILYWSAKVDLDLHLVGPTKRGTRFEVDYHNVEYLENGDTVCKLYDDWKYYGEEIIVLKVTDDSQPYYCFACRFGGDGQLSESYAEVVAYKGSKKIVDDTVSNVYRTDNYWNAFAIKNGKIIINDTITDYPDLNYAD